MLKIEENKVYPIYYIKSIMGGVGGRMRNERGDLIEFILLGDPNDKENIDEVIIELNDIKMEKEFLKLNKKAIKHGYLRLISDYELEVDDTNAVSDGKLKDILKLPFAKMKKEVEQFTEELPLMRLLSFAKENPNTIVKYIEYLEAALDEKKGKSV